MRNSAFSPKRLTLPPALLRFIWALVAVCSQVYGLDPNRAPSEYVFDEWGAEHDFAWGAVHSLAQTPDGYLWIGCEAGLVRFDGIAFQLISGQANGVPPGPVQQLSTDSEGSLWLLQRDMSLFRMKHGKAENILQTLTGNGKGVTAMATGGRGEVIFWNGASGIWCCQSNPARELYRDSVPRHHLLVIALAETRNHRLWMGSRDAGLLSVQNGNLLDYSAKVPDLKVNAILSDGEDRLWVGTDGGAIRWNGADLTAAGVPRELRKAPIVALARDHERNVWIASGKGLYRLTPAGDLSAVRTDRITVVNAIFEDREGNLWLGTDDGVARLRDTVSVSYPLSGRQRGTDENSAVYVDPVGRAWYSASGGLLNWRRGPETGQIRIGGASDIIYSISGQGPDVWAGRKLGGLTLIRCQHGCRVEHTYTEANGLADNSVTSVSSARDGGVWAGTANSGASKLAQNRFTSFTSKLGLASNSIRDIAQTADGTVWFATAEGLSAEHSGAWRTYNGSDGLPPGGINCLATDNEGVLWIGTSYGLAFLRNGRIQAVQSSALREPIFGLVAGNNDSLWIATAAHVLALKRSTVLLGQLSRSDTREFGARDGLLTEPVLKRSSKLTSDSLGRIWMSSGRGLSVLDPMRVLAQSAPALPHLQAVIADGADLRLSDRVEIPALRKRVEFDFIGVSLTEPQSVQYQYRLDKFDLDWSKPIFIREAVYTNLPPGDYRFRVRASNSGGVWSDKEESIAVRVQPAFWQTWSFETAGLLLIGSICAVAYQSRMRKVRQGLDVRFRERLAERTRIAQELHDTLLQGFLSASMQLHVACNRIEKDSPAKAPLQRATELMRKAGDEGRAALRQLRTEEDAVSLEDAFAAIPHESMMSDSIQFRLRVQGHSRRLRNVCRDDIYRISREAIVNAIRHSGAINIEVEVCYDHRQFRISVQDDGCGMNPQVLHSGREGHWGIRGMRERAERIKAKLSLLSRPGAGTEVVLRVPANLAYELEQQRTGSRLLTLLRKRYRLDRTTQKRA